MRDERNRNWRSYAACALFFGLAACGSTASRAATPHCDSDGEIARGQADAPAAVARSFAEAVLQGRPADAYRMFEPAVAAKVTPGAFASVVSSFDVARPYSGLRLAHVYRVHLEGTKPAGPIACGNSSDPDESVAVSALPIPEQFHVEQIASSRNNDWSITTWLVPGPGGWRVRAFYVGVQTSGGRSARQLLGEARRQRDARHGLNAALLYTAVQALTARGPDLQMGIASELASDLRSFERPAEIAGDPPYHWRLSGRDFLVSRLEFVGIGSKLYLLIYHSDPRWDGADFTSAGRINRALIEAFRRDHPEYAETFGGVVGRLLRSDGSGGFGTVYDNERGYLEAKDIPGS